MSSECCKKKQIDYLSLFKEDKELFELMKNYLRIKENYEEPKDARNMRENAERIITTNDADYSKAIRLMKTATKIIKVCNGL